VKGRFSFEFTLRAPVASEQRGEFFVQENNFSQLLEHGRTLTGSQTGIEIFRLLPEAAGKHDLPTDDEHTDASRAPFLHDTVNHRDAQVLKDSEVTIRPNRSARKPASN
jgi:hypothetical protein